LNGAAEVAMERKAIEKRDDSGGGQPRAEMKHPWREKARDEANGGQVDKQAKDGLGI